MMTVHQPVNPLPEKRTLNRGEACKVCKQRKVRCGGEKPSCRNCVDRSTTCTYPEPKESASTKRPDKVKHGHRRSASPATHALGDAVAHDGIPNYTSGPSVASSSWSSIPQAIPHSVSTSAFYHQPPPSTSATWMPDATPIADFIPPPVPTVPFENDPFNWLDERQLFSTLSSFMPTADHSTSPYQDVPRVEGLDLSWLYTLDEPPISTPDPLLQGLSVQEHCFRLYFSHPRISGLEMNIARFYERMQDSNPANRPDISLREAMCLSICRGSPILSVRTREEVFFENANKAIHEAMKDLATLPAKLLDLVRAATLVSNWLWSSCRDAEAVSMTAIAVRIALAMGLDCIGSPNVISGPMPNIRRFRRTFIQPAKDHIETADRIFAFWSVYIIDTAAAIATTFPANLHIADITTPIPQSWTAYETGNLAGDERLSDVFDPGKNRPSQTDTGHTIKAMALLHRASTIHLRSPLTTPFVPRSESQPGSSVSNFSESRVPQIELDPADKDRQDLFASIKRFRDTLPFDYKSVTTEKNGRKVLDARTAKLRMMTGVAEMYIYDTNSYVGPNDGAVKIARQMVDVLRLMTDVDDLSLFYYVLWTLVGRVLLRESKRLVREGDEIGAAMIDSDIEFIAVTLTKYAQSHHAPLIAGELQFLEAVKNAPPSDAGDDLGDMGDASTLIGST